MWGRHQTRKILIVTDPSSTALLTPSFLFQSDIRLLDTIPGANALARARDSSPALIIQNLAEPLAAALDLTRELKSDPSTASIPLIAIIEEGSDRQARRAGANVILTRPLVQREYWEAVRRFVSLPKRRGLRQLVNLRFTYHVDGRTRQAFSRDLSAYGAFLKTDQAVPQGTHLRVEFSIPGEAEPVCCGAIVHRAARFEPGCHHNAGFAIEFEGLDAPGMKRLERFVGRHLPRTAFGLLLG